MFTPSIPIGLFFFILSLTTSLPELLKPRRFIKALSFSNLKTLGFLFPYCFKGVTVPTSTKPKPKLNNEL